MITIRRAQKEDTTYLMKIYNQANELFRETEYFDGTDDIFEKMIEEDIVYLLFEKDIPIAFIASHEYENYILVTALYVNYNFQRNGYGKILLSYFERLYLPLEKYYIVKVLVNAPWAMNFYKKNGYRELSQENQNDTNVLQDKSNDSCMLQLKITQKPWSLLLIKVPKKEDIGTCNCNCNK